VYPVLFVLPDWFPLLGGQPITSFGVMMFAAFLTAAWVHRAEMRRLGKDPEITWDLLFWAVIGGILGAKLYYLFLHWDRTAADPLRALTARGGLVWYGGFLLATALVIWQIRKRGLNLPQQADITAPALALSYAVGRVGCFLVGDDYGRPTDSPLGIAFPQGSPPTTVENLESQFGVPVDPELIEKYGNVIPVHPTQLYETGMSTLIFFFLWKIRKHPHRGGWLFMVWLVLAGFERFLVEFLRAKDDRFLGPLTLAQMISLGLVAVGFVGMARLRGGASGTPRQKTAS
jgi:phosphatidylglycerol:prolipoprotein diacylglycerol transferase